MMTVLTASHAETQSVTIAHPLLYHYTREHAFRSIVKNNTLWATYFEDLNDSTEFRHMRTPLAEELGERSVPVVEAFSKRGQWQADTVRRHGGVAPAARMLSKLLTENLYKVSFGTPANERLHASFVASFCSHSPDGYAEKNGLLSQWRGYGGDGGFCFVFDTKQIEALIEEERQAYQYLFIRLGVAHYFKDRKSMPPHFAELVTLAKDVIELALAGSDFSVDGMFEPFISMATTTKHRAFEEESEVRLVAMPLSLLGDEKMKSVPGYRPLPFKTTFPCDIKNKTKHHMRLFGLERAALPVVRVIVGPARDQKRNAEIARNVVRKGVEVICSETPLII
jgi:hypothetical protein